MRKIAAVVLAAAVLLTAQRADFSAKASESAEISISSVKERAAEGSYEKYLEAHSEADHPSGSIGISLDRYTVLGSAVCAISSAADSIGMFSWQGTGSVTWSFNVADEGFYCLEMNYFSTSESNSFISFGVGIDGEYPFNEAREIRFDRFWRNRTSIRLDAEHKNQLLPELVRYDIANTAMARSSGISDEPLKFYLSKGEHTLTLNGVSTDFFIGSLKFCQSARVDPYSSIRPDTEQLKATPALIGKTPILVEAEMPKFTNSAALRPTSEPSDYAVSPSHPTYVRYNTIGADSWSTSGQTLFYEVTVPSEGYYAINLKCRMNGGSGLPAYRRIRINGSVLCDELDAVEISYCSDWQNISARTDAGELIFVHLNAGKNTVSFEAVNGKAGDALRGLENLADEIMNSIDSGEISANFDYYSEEVLSATNALEKAADRKIDGYELSALARVLKGYGKSSSEDFTELKKSIAAVYAWIERNDSRCVEMDYFELKTYHEEFRDIERNFFKQFAFGWERFWSSFFSGANDSRSDTVSVSTDKESAKVLNSILNGYSGEISVSDSSGSLLERALSGNAPDVALFVSEDEVYELASRGLIVNLSALRGYDSIEKLSTAGVTELYEYNGRAYGIPLTSSFPMMFCRTDILDELGLSVPESWDELEELLPVLSERGFTAGLGCVSELSEENALMLMLSQSGQEYEQGTAPEIKNLYVKTAFSRYTDFYTKYGCPEEYDALRMFKSGAMPIVIADYSKFYGQLSKESEIRGLWSVEHVPGTRRTSTSGKSVLDYSSGANSFGAVIFADSENISAAWDFIQWLAQPETQTRLGVMKEAISSEIYAPSNLEALSSLRPSSAESRRFSAQSSRIKEIPKSDALNELYRALLRELSEELSGSQRKR